MINNTDVSSLHGKQVAVVYSDYNEVYKVFVVGEVLNISSEGTLYIKEMGNHKVATIFVGAIKSINLLGAQLYSES